MSDTKEGVSTVARLNWLRAGVLGANDGIVSTAGVVVGVAAANPANNEGIIMAGIAAIVAGALSMAMGEYVSVSTQRDTEIAVVAKEKHLIATNPEKEFEQLVQAYMDTGLSEETARKVAYEYHQKDPIQAHVSMEYGLSAEEYTNPWHAALSSAVAFTLGALLPFIAILITPWLVPNWPFLRIPVTFIAVVLALFIAGYTSARLGQADWKRAVIRVVAGGSLAMIVTGGIGRIVGVAI